MKDPLVNDDSVTGTQEIVLKSIDSCLRGEKDKNR